MALFDALNNFSESLRSVNQSMGVTLDKMESGTTQRVHNFEALNKDIGLTQNSIHNMADTFDNSFSPSISNSEDLMDDFGQSTKNAFDISRVKDWREELDKVLDTTGLATDKYDGFRTEVARSNEEMARTMDTLATTSGQAVLSTWKEADFAASSLSNTVRTVSSNYTRFLSLAKEGVSRADATRRANEALAKTYEEGTEQRELATQVAEKAGEASGFLSQNLYMVAGGAAAATAALIALYAVTSNAVTLQTELREALRDTNLTWQEQDTLLGELAIDAAYTGRTISELADNYSILYSQQLAGIDATEDFTDSLNTTTVALNLSSQEAGNLAFTYGKVLAVGVEGFEGVSSAIKSAGMNTALTTQEAAGLTQQMDELLLRFSEFPKEAIPGILAAGAAMKQTGGDVTELIGKMSDMFDLTNMEAQRLKGLMAATAGGFDAVSEMLDAKDTSQMLGMVNESLKDIAPTEEQFNSMRGFYAEMYGLSERTLTSIYRMDDAMLEQMQTQQRMLQQAQASTEPLNEAFSRARMSFSNAFQRFWSGFTALLGLLGRPFVSVLTVVFSVFASLSLAVTRVAATIQRMINYLESIPVVGILVTTVVTALSLAIGTLGLAIAGLMAYNIGAYFWTTYSLGTKATAVIGQMTSAISLQNIATYKSITADQYKQASMLGKIKMAYAGIRARALETAKTIKNTLVEWEGIVVDRLKQTELGKTIALKYTNIKATIASTASTWKDTIARKASAAAQWMQNTSLYQNTIAVIANSTAWYANPIIWIAAAVLGVAAAFEYLGTTLGFVTAAVVALGIAWYASGIGAVISLIAGIIFGIVAAVKLLASGISWLVDNVGSLGKVMLSIMVPVYGLYNVFTWLNDTLGSLGKAVMSFVFPLYGLYNIINMVWDAIWGHSLGTGLLLLLDVFKAVGSFVQGTILGIFEGLANMVNVAFRAVKGLVEIGFSGLAGVGAGLAALGSGFAALGLGMGLAAPGVLAFMAAMGLARLFGFGAGGEGISGIMGSLVASFDFSNLNLERANEQIWMMVNFIRGFTEAMLSMMTASGVASLITGGLLGSFLGFFGIGSPMDKLSRRAPLIFGSIRELSESLQEQMKSVNLGHATAQIGMFSSVMSSLASSMRDYKKVANLAERHKRMGPVEIEPMMENVNRIRESIKLELLETEARTQEQDEPIRAGEETATISDVVSALGSIHKTLISYAQAHEDDDLERMAENLAWSTD